jgi:hypothetical protein
METKSSMLTVRVDPPAMYARTPDCPIWIDTAADVVVVESDFNPTVTCTVYEDELSSVYADSLKKRGSFDVDVMYGS